MGMTSGTLVIETAFKATGVFPPPGAEGHLNSATISQGARPQANYSFGTTTSQVDTIVFQDRNLAAGANATYDIYTGTDLLDFNGGTAAFRTVRYFGVYIVSGGDTSGVRIGGAAANEWVGFFAAAGDMQKIFPDGPPYQGGSPAGVAVTSTTKNIKIENLGAIAVTVRIVIGGSIQVSGGFTGLFSGYMTYP